ncbi:Dihydroorotase [Legionella massiliensis]|uniref:Dihydroorotase n=1 Tax=Legionella massiliensis TaxID=1034943 RepID=A0A078KSK6_9GAMM|nr:dihydroorotase [Legionella massiliensis]CDZ76056.1 Dihydroorotase [Legionella massiliensis]CEE11794.1 Dihydroorotase [Legionella massiliensis]
MQSLLITRPDDWHVHFRDGLVLENTVSATAKHFARALVMPNLKPALISLDALLAYRERILSALQQDYSFNPYMTFYLNEQVNPEDLQNAKNFPCILGAKLYPAGATTNSDEGARSLKALYPLLDIMQQQNLVLQIHGEVTHGDIFHREAEFIKTCLAPLAANFPKLRIVLEHISTKSAVEFVTQASENIAATITPHHLFYNRNQLLAGGIRPHYYCLPILKKETDQKALQQAATSGNRKFFAGTDSAPHAQTSKESACGCAGIYSAPYAVAMYAQSFAELNQLDRLNAFLGHFGAEFYQLPINQSELLLKRISQSIPKELPLGKEQVVPVAAGEELEWSVYESA